MRTTALIGLIALTGCVPDISFVTTDAAVDGDTVEDLGNDAERLSFLPCADWSQCPNRRFEEVGPMHRFGETRGLDIALSRGTIAFAWEDFKFPDQSILRTHVLGASSAETRSFLGQFEGREVSLSSLGDRFGVISASLLDGSGTLSFRSLRVDGTLGDPQPIQEIPTLVRIDSVGQSDGRVTSVHYDGDLREFVSHQSNQARDEWSRKRLSALADSPRSVSGSIALNVDSSDVVRVVYQNNGQLVYARATGDNWGFPNKLTVANEQNGSGLATDLFEREMAMVFYSERLDQAQIRLARFDVDTEVFQEFTLVQNIPTQRSPYYPLALKNDLEGHLHVLVGVQQDDLWSVQYFRELTPKSNDFVEERVVGGLTEKPHVALEVGDNGVPHIAYYQRPSLHYATVRP